MPLGRWNFAWKSTKTQIHVECSLHVNNCTRGEGGELLMLSMINVTPPENILVKIYAQKLTNNLSY